jgi:hypothetical protein
MLSYGIEEKSYKGSDHILLLHVCYAGRASTGEPIKGRVLQQVNTFAPS